MRFSARSAPPATPTSTIRTRRRFAVRDPDAAGSILQLVRFPEPIRDRRLDLIAVHHVDEVGYSRRRAALGAPHLRSSQRAAEEHADFKRFSPRANKEVARSPREHDRGAGGIDPLLAEFDGGLA